MNHPLVENYIYEVSRRLSGREKEDILQELRANIYDMLPDDATDEQVKEVLNQLGDPAMFASQYPSGQRYLISPMIYDEYVTAVKWIVPLFALVLAGIGLLTGFLGAFGDGFSVLRLVTNPFFNAITMGLSGGFHALFWTTLGFIVAERLGFTSDVKKGVSQLDHLGREEVKKRFKQMEEFDGEELKESIQRKVEYFKKWDADELPNEEIPKKPKHSIPISDSIAELVVGLLFGIGFLLYLLGMLPWASLAVIDGVKILEILTPEFIAVMIPITIIIILLTAFEKVVKIIVRQWTPFVGVTVIITSLVSCGLLFYAFLQQPVFQDAFANLLQGRIGGIPLVSWTIDHLPMVLCGIFLVGTMFEIGVAFYHMVGRYLSKQN